MMTGTSLKQYILGRKLAAAAEELKNPQKSITDVAYALGFEYPEVFSRDFKKSFGVSPAGYRNGNVEIAPMSKATVVERDIMNFQGVLALKETYVELDEQNLHGIFIDVNEHADGFKDSLQSTGERFFANERYHTIWKGEFFYTVVNCHGDNSGKYSVFFGGEAAEGNNDCGLTVRNIPAGCYVCFTYHGDMLAMRATFNDDFYKWILVKEIELCPNGIGMINMYDRQDMSDVRILVPVKHPK